MDNPGYNTNENIKKKLSSAELRKIKKPIIEKKRRCRINESLTQLKTLILEAMNKDESQYNKMEKADILELTVRHLRNLHNNYRGSLFQKQSSQEHGVTFHDNGVHCEKSVQLADSVNNNNTINNINLQQTPKQNTLVLDAEMGEVCVPRRKTEEQHRRTYSDGFSKCIQEVNDYLSSCASLRHYVKDEINKHLSTCLNQNLNTTVTATPVYNEQSNLDTQVSQKQRSLLPNVVQVLPGNISNESIQVSQCSEQIGTQQFLQNISCVQPIQLVNGQTIFVANALPTFVQQPTSFLNTQTGEICQLVDQNYLQLTDQRGFSGFVTGNGHIDHHRTVESLPQLQVLTCTVSPPGAQIRSVSNESMVSPVLILSDTDSEHTQSPPCHNNTTLFQPKPTHVFKLNTNEIIKNHVKLNANCTSVSAHETKVNNVEQVNTKSTMCSREGSLHMTADKQTTSKPSVKQTNKGSSDCTNKQNSTSSKSQKQNLSQVEFEPSGSNFTDKQVSNNGLMLNEQRFLDCTNEQNTVSSLSQKQNFSQMEVEPSVSKLAMKRTPQNGLMFNEQRIHDCSYTLNTISSTPQEHHFPQMEVEPSSSKLAMKQQNNCVMLNEQRFSDKQNKVSSTSQKQSSPQMEVEPSSFKLLIKPTSKGGLMLNELRFSESTNKQKKFSSPSLKQQIPQIEVDDMWRPWNK